MQSTLLPGLPRDLANPALLTSVVSLGTDPWQQNITPILEGSEHIGQIFQQSEMF